MTKPWCPMPDEPRYMLIAYELQNNERVYECFHCPLRVSSSAQLEAGKTAFRGLCHTQTVPV